MKQARLSIMWVVLVSMLVGCKSSPPAWPAAADVRWATYARDDVGFSVEYPDTFRSEQIGDDTVFYANGFPIFRVLLVNVEAARQRGLWAVSKPVEAVTIAGQAAQRYAYNHGDFVTYTPTIAYVLPWHDKELGIEFRMGGDVLNDTAQHMLDSFRLTRK